METITRKPLSLMFIVVLVLAGLVLLSSISPAAATLEDDEKECAEQLTNLAACIPFVSGTAKQPTKECCDYTTKLRASMPKCLCVLIKESTDPALGLPINTTLALQMPAACHIDAKVSDCPALLNLPADSPDANIFKVANADSSSSTTPATNDSSPDTTSPSTKPPSSSSSSSSSTSTTSPADTKATSATSNGAKIASSIILGMGLASLSLLFI